MLVTVVWAASATQKSIIIFGKFERLVSVCISAVTQNYF